MFNNQCNIIINFGEMEALSVKTPNKEEIKKVVNKYYKKKRQMKCNLMKERKNSALFLCKKVKKSMKKNNSSKYDE